MVEQARGKRRVEIGVVTSDKMQKTRRVEIPRLVKHPRYGKYIKRRTICYVHDEANTSHVGDTEGGNKKDVIGCRSHPELTVCPGLAQLDSASA